ncbi:MAG TPA: type II secretion system F family protein [Aggregatilineales bacterium]|nr:type II secretion system F family protein [Anaerolineales bacterium]HRE47067.1 type II secretion system F family protein [Aggregatilineales bacterium]
MDVQTIGIIAIILGGVGLFGGLIWVGMRDNKDQDPLQARLAEFGDRELPQSLEDLEMSLSFRDRVLLPTFKAMAGLMTRFTPESQIEQTRHLIELSGQSQKTDARTFFGTRIMMTILLGVGGFIMFFIIAKQAPLNAIGLTALMAFMGYYLPTSQLKSKIRKRQDNIVKALPDALDLLTICVEAGLGFDQAMGKVYEKWDNELSVAFGRVIQEIALGKMRREALRDMAKSMEVPDVTSFTAAIIQADQLGVSMAKILRIQSDQMRIKRRQRAQEKAHQAPVKMMIPMVFLIFPSIWIVLLGPSLIILMTTNIAL